MKKGQRITKKRIDSEIRKMRRLLPAWYRDNEEVSSLQTAVANYEHAIIATTESLNDKFEFTTHGLKLMLWLYQFEFFEKEFVINNYKTSHAHYLKDGTRHASLKFKELINDNLIVPFEKRNYKYYEELKRENYNVLEEKKSNNTFQLSSEALNIISVFYSALTNSKPSLYQKENKIMKSDGQSYDEFDNLNGGWDYILNSF